jgi:uncharacterized protein
MLVRYRTGMNAASGGFLSGFDHVRQSIATILTTALEERVMRLEFGADLIRQIGRNMGRDVILQIFRRATEAVHRHEPEFRVKQIEIKTVERTGGLSLILRGLYYPEGRLGNFSIFETREAIVMVAGGETIGRSR